MTLPTMRAGLTSQEFLRLGGGFGATASGTSPEGGLDADNAGNLAMDGDLTVDGTADFAGGYGDDGVSISQAGDLDVDGDTFIEGTLDVLGGSAAGGTSIMADSIVSDASTLRINDDLVGGAFLVMSKANGASCQIHSRVANKDRWVIVLANNSNESGGDAGSNFAVNRFDDNGAYLDSPLVLNRATGDVTLANKCTIQDTTTLAGDLKINGSHLKLPVKTTAGDPSTPSDGWMYVNTADNKIRVYADGSWRDLATW